MSITDLKEANDKGNVLFGIKQALKDEKSGKEDKKGKKKTKVKTGKKADSKKIFVAKDCREETVQELKKNGIEAEMLKKTKAEITKELGLNFESEVFTIQ